MPDILTITLKPAVDFATTTAHVQPGPKLYCDAPRVDPGGGGVNVARAILRLGGDVRAFVVVGGATGDRLLALLAGEGVPILECRVAAETGFSLAVSDAGSGGQYRFCLPPEALGAAEAAMILDDIAAAVPAGGFAVLSGGVPPGLPDDFVQRVQAVVRKAGARLIVDTSRAPLMQLIASPRGPVDVLRLDRSEIETAMGRQMRRVADTLACCRQLVNRGVARIVVSGHGAEGSVMVTEDRGVFCRAPHVPVRSKVGAGDALVGAFTRSIARGDSPDLALRWGVAAAAATVGTEGTALFDPADVDRLLPECRLETSPGDPSPDAPPGAP